MNRFSSRWTFWACVALLALSAGWDLGFQPDRLAAQSATGDGVFDPAILKAFQWRSIGPAPRRPIDRGLRREGTAEGSVLRRHRRRTLEDHRRRAQAGRRLPTARSRARRSARSPCRSQTLMSSTSAWASRASAATSCPAMASTSRPMPARRGSTSASRTRTRSAKIRIHPTNPDIVFVADFGKYGAPSDERGVFKSTDGGRTWKKVLFKDNKTGGVDVAIDRRNPNVMFAGLWEAYRIEYQMSSGGPGSGLYKSTDGGDTWREITRATGLPQRPRRQDQHRHLRRRLESRLRDARERKRRPLQHGRCGRDLEAGERRPQHPPARVLLHARLRRPEQQGHRLHAEHERLPLDRRRQDAHQHRQRHARRPSRSVDRSGRFAARDRSPTTAAAPSPTTSPSPQRAWTGQEFATAQLYHVITTKHAPFHVCGAQQDNTTLCIRQQHEPRTRRRRRRRRVPTS